MQLAYTHMRLICPVCKIEQTLEVRISTGETEIKPGVFLWVPQGEQYANCSYKNCRHTLTATEINEQDDIKITSPADYGRALKTIY